MPDITKPQNISTMQVVPLRGVPQEVCAHRGHAAPALPLKGAPTWHQFKHGQSSRSSLHCSRRRSQHGYAGGPTCRRRLACCDCCCWKLPGGSGPPYPSWYPPMPRPPPLKLPRAPRPRPRSWRPWPPRPLWNPPGPRPELCCLWMPPPCSASRRRSETRCLSHRMPPPHPAACDGQQQSSRGAAA